MSQIDTSDFAALDRTTKAIVRGEQAEAERKDIVMRLWQAGITQRELAERMTRASLAVGGETVTGNAVYKLIRRVKKQENAA